MVRAVVKFGGGDLSSGEKVRKAAEMVVNSGFEETVVVVSAMGKTTDNLIQCIHKLGDLSPLDYADIIAMGERTSARIFSSALRALGANSIYLDPQMENWPIVTDSNFLGAKPDLKRTRLLVKKFVVPHLGHTIPVICGFLGRDDRGRITTLGRGGSDTTAILLGNCMEADEVILVKETEGVLSADPKLVSSVRPIERINIDEMFALAWGGAKIVRSESLRYKLPGQKLRIINFSSGNLREGGTEITGVFNSGRVENRVIRGLSAITVVGDMDSHNLGELFKALGDISVLGVSTGRMSLTTFLRMEDENRILKKIHDLGFFKAVSLMRNVGMIELTHPDFIESPGWVAKISNALASKKINIIEVTTSKSSIDIFVNDEMLDKASSAVGDAIEI